MKCADGLRSAIRYSEKSVGNLLGEITLFIIYLFIYLFIVQLKTQSVRQTTNIQRQMSG